MKELWQKMQEEQNSDMEEYEQYYLEKNKEKEERPSDPFELEDLGAL